MSSNKRSKELQQRIWTLTLFTRRSSAREDNDVIVITDATRGRSCKATRPTKNAAAVAGRDTHERNALQEMHSATAANAKVTTAHYAASEPSCLSRIVISPFLDTVTDNRKNAWISSITINGTKMPFKLDTGAEVTAVSKETWERLGKPTLQPPSKQLFGPAQHPLQVLGQFYCHLTHTGRESQQQVFVVKQLQTNLLGLPAINALQLAVRMDSFATSDTESWQKSFPKVFQGLGTLKGDSHSALP